MFHFWINTRFIDNNYLRLSKQVLDKAVKDKKCKMFRADFMVELFLDRVSPCHPVALLSYLMHLARLVVAVRWCC